MIQNWQAVFAHQTSRLNTFSFVQEHVPTPALVSLIYRYVVPYDLLKYNTLVCKNSDSLSVIKVKQIQLVFI